MLLTQKKSCWNELYSGYDKTNETRNVVYELLVLLTLTYGLIIHQFNVQGSTLCYGLCLENYLCYSYTRLFLYKSIVYKNI